MYKMARAKFVLGQHKALEMHRYTPPQPNAEHRIKLTDDKGECIGQDMSMKEVHNHITPGYILSPLLMPHATEMRNVKSMKEGEVHKTFNGYKLVKAGLENFNAAKAKKETEHNTVFFDCKIMPFSGKRLSSPYEFSLNMQRIHRFLEDRHPVELQMRLPGRKLKKKKRSEKEYSLYPDKDLVLQEEWEWLHAHWPHLRPDNILKSMPKGTQVWLPPYTNGANLYWVFGPPWAFSMNLGKKIEEMKTKVREEIKKGNQMQLPKKFREQLHASGQTEYSSDSDMPAGKISDRLINHELELEQSDLRHRYMPLKTKSWIKQKGGKGGRTEAKFFSRNR
ncbi:hypothetical protein DM02DRAFT_630227 [Periconia macrospinosa]|uniref:Uncharacterized protein n=1 Tax=Periconia macrospinosa TaxID=97972 RepID=A0A2V1DK28_9PLEO|nr:hypothetical protein DM02DRAFT_630227 [Periconia macrospinosa]